MISKYLQCQPVFLTIVLMLILMGGRPSVYAEERKRDLKMNHYKHIVEEEKTCEDCHEEGAEKEKLLPKEEICADCHEEHMGSRAGDADADEGAGDDEDAGDDEEKDEGDKSAKFDKEKCLYCHTGTLADLAELEKGTRKIRVGPRPYKNLEFTHKAHLDKDLKCEACHGEISQNKGLEIPVGKYMPTSRQCLDCHLEEIEGFRVQDACQDCHTKDTFNQNFKPAQHQAQWPKYHGTVSHLNEGTHGKDCITCHVPNKCVECHNTEKPKDHTQFWQTRGHGLMAGANRERCLTCHKQDTCVGCHNETAPRTHIGSWDKKHCTGECHLDLIAAPNEGCLLCHRVPRHIKK